MKFNYDLPCSVDDFIKNSELNEISIGCSDSQVIKIVKHDNTYFLKMAKIGMLEKEFNALKWLDGKLPVPKIVLFDRNEDYEFLITESLHGEMLCSKKYQDNPEQGIKIIGEAFKKIYSVDITSCPFNVSNDYKLSLIYNYINNNLLKEENIKPEVLDKYGSIENIFKFLKENRFKEELCFSHGDTSLPNFFAQDDHFSGFIDLGECGIADKWFDLAICEKSIIRNYGEKYIDQFYKELGIIPDRDKINYYLLMMELYL